MNNRGLLVIVSAIAVMSCGKKAPVALAPPAPADGRPVAASAPSPPPAMAPSGMPVAAPVPTEDELFARKTLDQLNAERPLTDVFFVFDSAALSDDARLALSANATWLRRWAGTTIRVEGHADERGTSEYNFALGDVRAQNVRGYLLDLGITPERIHVVTKGEEAPFCAETAESCWSQNRRAHFLIVAK